MLTAISRYGARVIPGTGQLIADIERRGQLVEGPHVAVFEEAFAERLGSGVRAVSTSYGRMAFYYILKAMDFPAGSEIVMPALTFWVMPEMARQAGLKPVFADVDPATFNITAASIERVVTPRTVAIVPTHLWGLPCDMDAILELAGQRGLRVIEDCAHALGARYRDRQAGTLGDAAIFSFQTLKPLNAYGGGMAVVRDPTLAARVADLAGAEPLPGLERVTDRLWKGRVLRIATRPGIFTWTLFPIMYLGARLQWSIDMYFWEKIRP
ncbi:MAG: aminotransferase class I/II-fold pyridoxal phosphate-dependent enzyme, partial [Acidobacteriota bacterium]